MEALAAGLDYVTVSGAIRRFEDQMERDKHLTNLSQEPNPSWRFKAGCCRNRDIGRLGEVIFLQLRQERPICRIPNPFLFSNSFRSDLFDNKDPHPGQPRLRYRPAGARRMPFIDTLAYK